MNFTKEQLTDWKRYERVRSSGRWNMITHSYNAMREAGLSRERYVFVLENYSALKEAYENTQRNP